MPSAPSLIVCAAAGIPLLLYWIHRRWYKVPTRATHHHHTHHLDDFPSTLGSIVPVVFNQIVSKYGYRGYLEDTEWGRQRKLPKMITTIGPFQIDPIHLAKYKQCVGILDESKLTSNPVPFGYYHCLCVKLLLFTLGKRKEFPLKLLGAVHWKSTMNIAKRVHAEDCKICIETKVNTDVHLTAKQDLTFSVTHRVTTSPDNGLIGEITDLYLLRAPKKYRTADNMEKTDYFKIENQSDGFVIDGDERKWYEISCRTPLEYSMLCGDINPIHIHPYLAKLFGFKSNIAHGMWSGAKIMHYLMNDLHIGKAHGTETNIVIEIIFERPLLLPNTPSLQVIRMEQDGKEERRFRLLDYRDKMILQGYCQL